MWTRKFENHTYISGRKRVMSNRLLSRYRTLASFSVFRHDVARETLKICSENDTMAKSQFLQSDRSTTRKRHHEHFKRSQ